MIITRTPMRVSFAGGGSDLPVFYEHEQEPGAVLAAAIDRYMYISVNPRPTRGYRIGYSVTEHAATVHDIRHDIARETLRALGHDGGLEVVSVADVPAGTGLGSSSAYAVGLACALSALNNAPLAARALAETACAVEIDRCMKHIGKQDQYAAAFGGLRLYQFTPDVVTVGSNIFEWNIEQHLLMIDASDGKRGHPPRAGWSDDTRAATRDMAALAVALARTVTDGNLHEFARLMRDAWVLKQHTHAVPEYIAGMVKVAEKHGALAGKLCGAGGQGFLLLIAPPDSHERITRALARAVTFAPHIAQHGARVVYRD